MSSVSSYFLIIYTDSTSNNITVSPRTGNGHYMPSYNSSAQTTLLAGSGVSNGVMTANIKCSNFTSGLSIGSDWIWAYLSGSPLNTDSQSAGISKHNGNGTLTFDSTAQGGSDMNPFVRLNSSSTIGTACSSVSSARGSMPTTGFSKLKRSSNEYTAEELVKRAVESPNCATSNGDLVSSGVSVSTGDGGWFAAAHGIIAGAVLCVVFPIGGIMIRLLSFRGLLWAHGILQSVAYVLYVVAMGLGVKLATDLVCILFFLQFLSLIKHSITYKTHTQSSVLS